MRAPRGSTPGKICRARLSLINTAPGVSSSSNQRPLDQRHPQQPREIRRDRAHRGAARVAVDVLDRLAFLDHQPHRVAARRQAGLEHAGQRLRPGQQRRRVIAAGPLVAILRPAEVHAHRQQLIGYEAGGGVVICQTLLSIRPAPASSTTVRATCSATIARPASRTRRDADTLRPPSFKTSCTFVKHKRDRRPDAEEQRRADRDTRARRPSRRDRASSR